MDKQRKSLSTKKPPIGSSDYKVIQDWKSTRIMPGILPLIEKIDQLIHDLIPNLQYAIKWGNAFYGTSELGWIIEVAAYDVSANLVFLSGSNFDPKPSLGSGEETRYVKLRSADELDNEDISNFVKQAGSTLGWE